MPLRLCQLPVRQPAFISHQFAHPWLNPGNARLPEQQACNNQSSLCAPSGFGAGRLSGSSPLSIITLVMSRTLCSIGMSGPRPLKSRRAFSEDSWVFLPVGGTGHGEQLWWQK